MRLPAGTHAAPLLTHPSLLLTLTAALLALPAACLSPLGDLCVTGVSCALVGA